MFFSQTQENDQISPTPNSTPDVTISIPQRITQAVKKAPHMLMRISSSYFQPMESPKRKILKKRPESLKVTNEEEITSHRRIFSNPTKVKPDSSPKNENLSINVCNMCYDRFSNAVIMECGHGGICYECSLELWKSTGACHMCRSPISQVLQIEVNPSKTVKVCSTTRAIYYDNH